MLLSHLRPEGERFLRGEGPRRLRVAGGAGRWPRYEGAAYAFSVALPLTSVPRLRMMYALCTGGWTRGPALARRLEMHVNSVHGALNGMLDMGLVERRRAPISRGRSRSRLGGVYALEWRASEIGPMFLWRFGWVTGYLMPWAWEQVGIDGSEEVDPLEGLARDGQASLVRPESLALAHHLLHRAATTDLDLARRLGLSRGGIMRQTRQWHELGWIAEAARHDPMDRFRTRVHHAPAWRFTSLGFRMVERHVQAVRWAAQRCGYRAGEEDRLYREGRAE